MIDFEDLRLVQAIADAGGVTAAADRLHLVQSAVTARLQRLESALGVTLFERRPRGMRATEAGLRLLRGAGPLLNARQDLLNAVRATGGPAAPLRLGSMETVAATRLPGLLAAQRAAWPDSDIRLTTGTTDELLDGVLDRTLDLAIVAGPVTHDGLAAHTLWTETLVRIAAPGAVDGVLIGFRNGCSYRARAEHWLRLSGRVPYRVLELGTLDGILGCVAAGLGFAVLPARLLTGRETLFIDPLDPVDGIHTPGVVPVQIVWRRDADLPPPAAGFRDRADLG